MASKTAPSALKSASRMLKEGDGQAAIAGFEALYRSCLAESGGVAADWLALDEQQLEVTVHRLPTSEDITLPVDVGFWLSNCCPAKGRGESMKVGLSCCESMSNAT